MSFTNKTPNYNLPQYVGGDKPQWLTDINGAMSTIDVTMHDNATKLAGYDGQFQDFANQIQTANNTANDALNTATSANATASNAVGIANNAVAQIQAVKGWQEISLNTTTIQSSLIPSIQNKATIGLLHAHYSEQLELQILEILFGLSETVTLTTYTPKTSNGAGFNFFPIANLSMSANEVESIYSYGKWIVVLENSSLNILPAGIAIYNNDLWCGIGANSSVKQLTINANTIYTFGQTPFQFSGHFQNIRTKNWIVI